jgi:hypothetical protein
MQRITWLPGLAAALTLASLLSTNDAGAALYLDIDSESLSREVAAGQTVSGTFDIVSPGSDCILIVCDQGGFVPSSEELSWAALVFTFYEFGDISYSIDLGTGAQTLTDPATFSLFGIRVEIGALEDAGLDDLETDGQLAWSVTNDAPSLLSSSACFRDCNGGDAFELKFAKLIAGTERPVPEPSAAALFAAGFLLVGRAVRRRPRA